MNLNNQPNKAKRSRIYYPSSGIRTNLFTKGGYLMTEDYDEYVGFYHIYNSGEIFSEGEWDENVSKKLLLIDEKLLDVKDNSIKKMFNSLEYTNGVNVSRFKAPIEYNLIPSPEDYDRGVITRYFLGKVNDVNYPIKEIDEETFQSIGSEQGVDNLLFKGIELNWLLKGPLYDILDEDGSIKTSGVYDTNLRMIRQYTKELPNLDMFLTNPIEYSVHSKYYSVNLI